eukprot:TRINITY_DN1947_c0_g1_i1.p1 TRINITY_DN1947_c0_g1~~TRINITY_DN1947_c0_g1_i1.p1  ORF type:complete len:713 (+),score=141.44 TRINITY_DN1947_c0_g1_i1:28-2166(+)
MEFQQNALKNLLKTSSLNIFAEGLDHLFIIESFFRIIDKKESKYLIFFLNAPSNFMINSFIKHRLNNLNVQDINNLTNTMRLKLYEKGGIFLVSTTVLSTDLLLNNLPTNLNNFKPYLIVNSADIFMNTPIGYFCCRLFFERFINDCNIHAFSNNAASFSTKPLEEICNFFHVEKVELFSRFTNSVRNSLDVIPVKTIVTEISCSTPLIRVKNALIETAKSMRNMYKHVLPENDSTKKFLSLSGNDLLLPLNSSIKNVPKDLLLGLKCLRRIFHQVFVGFSLDSYILVRSIIQRYQSLPSSEIPLWFSSIIANDVLKVVEERILKDRIINIDPQPKYEAALRLIEKEQANGREMILIICDSNEVSCFRDVLLYGNVEAERQAVATVFDLDIPFIEQGTKFINTNRLIIIGNKDISQDLLQNLAPDCVILIDGNIRTFRQIEMYGAAFEGSKRIILHLLLLSRFSKQYFEIIRDRESEAFRSLVSSRLKLEKPVFKMPQARTNDVIIVDTRETRSALPYCLYELGVNIEISRLQTADYIISPTCGIERKTLSDLASSITKGRLQAQLMELVEAFPEPILLIELPYEGFDAFLRNTRLHNQVTSVVLSFPSLKVLYGKGPKNCAEILVDLVAVLPNPNVDLYGNNNASTFAMFKFLPNISSSTHLQFLNRLKRKDTSNFNQIIHMNIDELNELFENRETAGLVHRFFNHKFIIE